MSIYFDKNKSRWIARVKEEQGYTFIGTYHTQEDAITADHHFSETGEKLRTAPVKVDRRFHQPNHDGYPEYEELRQRYKDQVKKITNQYMRTAA